MELKVGDKAPGFTLSSASGDKVSLQDYLGKKNVVLYFYPKDGTPGCTKEACSFRDDFQRYRELGAEVLGVSLDSLGSHRGFAGRHGLPFILLSDGEGRVSEAYGVLRKTLGLRRASRVTFIVDRQGVIRRIFLKVKVSGHSEEVLKALKDI